jgi:exosortase A
MHADPILEAHLARSMRRSEAAVVWAVTLALVAIFGAYYGTFFSMVWTWVRSETFTHGFVVLPIFLWLVWRDRARLAAIEPRPFPPALAAIAALGMIWLLGELASVLVVPQFAITLMIPAVLWAAFGTEFVRALAFPLAFLLFAVPFGEAFVPKMMDWTADFAVLAIRLSGVPVYREGNHFMIPSGAWSVVEACSGIRYLIASMVAGALYAHLIYRSTARRWTFFAVSIAVPIAANWLRAYMIVMLGHLTGNRIAVGVDHLIYGWVFFGVVMAALFWIGSRWREDVPVPAAQPPDRFGAAVPRFVPGRNVVAMAGVTLALAVGWPFLPLAAERGIPLQTVVLGGVPGQNGWVRTPGAAVDWTPRFGGWRARDTASFVKDGNAVGLFIGYYRDQEQGRELIGSANQLVVSRDRIWNLVARGVRAVPVGSVELAVQTSEIRSARDRIVAWHWYWVDGKWTTNDYVAKLWLAWARLLGRSDDSAVVVVHASRDTLDTRADAVLESFVREMLSPIEASLTRARAQP